MPVPDNLIAEIKGRERGGLIELPRRDGLKAGDQVRILAGPFEGHFGLYAGMRPHERVLVLLALLGVAGRARSKRHRGRALLRGGSPRHRAGGRAALPRRTGHTISVAPSVTIRPLMLIPAQRVSSHLS